MGLANRFGVREGLAVKDGKGPSSFPELSPWVSGNECKPNRTCPPRQKACRGEISSRPHGGSGLQSRELPEAEMSPGWGHTVPGGISCCCLRHPGCPGVVSSNSCGHMTPRPVPRAQHQPGACSQLTSGPCLPLHPGKSWVSGWPDLAWNPHEARLTSHAWQSPKESKSGPGTVVRVRGGGVKTRQI